MFDSAELKFLLLEDDPDHIDIFLSNLELTSYHNVAVEHRDTLDAGLALLKAESFNLVFVDLSLKDSAVVSTLGQLKTIASYCPVIVVTSLDDKNTLLDIIQRGADDCLPKSELNDFVLERTIHYNLDRALLNKQLTESEAAYKDLYHNSPIYHATFDYITRAIISCNNTLAKSIGWHVDDLIGLDVLNIYHPNSMDRALNVHQHLSERDWLENEHLQLIRKDGGARDVLLNLSVIRGLSGDVAHCHATWVDITEKNKAEKELQNLQKLQQQIFDTVNSPIWLKDLQGHYKAFNSSFCKLLGDSAENIMGKASGDFFDGSHTAAVEVLEKESLSNWPLTKEVWIKSNSSKDKILLEITKSPLIDEEGNITGVVSYGHDVTDRDRLNKELAFIAEHDGLTQLPNRLMFNALFSKLIQRCCRHKTIAAVLFIDLDGFKEVNDTYGHEAGDQVLIETAQRIQNAIRGEDIIGRHGGDEFMLALADLHSTDDVTPLLERLMKPIQAPIELQYEEQNIVVSLSASIGVTFYQGDERSLKELLIEADEAMYQAKKQGKNCYVIHQSDDKG